VHAAKHTERLKISTDRSVRCIYMSVHMINRYELNHDMYVHMMLFMYLYMLCTYSSILVHNFIYMYIHVCTMYRDVCTDLPILVQVVRIPDVYLHIILQTAGGKDRYLQMGMVG
jgi:hypothetical protein